MSKRRRQQQQQQDQQQQFDLEQQQEKRQKLDEQAIDNMVPDQKMENRVEAKLELKFKCEMFEWLSIPNQCRMVSQLGRGVYKKYHKTTKRKWTAWKKPVVRDLRLCKRLGNDNPFTQKRFLHSNEGWALLKKMPTMLLLSDNRLVQLAIDYVSLHAAYDHAKEIVADGIMPAVIKLLSKNIDTTTTEMRFDALRTIQKLINCLYDESAHSERVKYLVSIGVIKVLCRLLSEEQERVMLSEVLERLYELYDQAERRKQREEIKKEIEQYGGLVEIQRLSHYVLERPKPNSRKEQRRRRRLFLGLVNDDNVVDVGATAAKLLSKMGTEEEDEEE